MSHTAVMPIATVIVVRFTGKTVTRAIQTPKTINVTKGPEFASWCIEPCANPA
jgi:hypothetical protein